MKTERQIAIENLHNAVENLKHEIKKQIKPDLIKINDFLIKVIKKWL